MTVHRDGQLLGFQTYTLYRIQTPFFSSKIPFVFGGLAFQHNQLAGRLFFLRRYAFTICTPTRRLIQIMAAQYQLIYFGDGLLTPPIVPFAQQFRRDVRPINHPIDNQLVIHGKTAATDSTIMWATLFKASNERYNQLALDASSIRQ